MMEAHMRKALLASIVAGAAPIALAITPSPASAGAAVLAPKAFDAPSAVTRIDYRRHHYRGYRTYYRGPAYSYYAPRAYYRAPAYYAPPVVAFGPHRRVPHRPAAIRGVQR
jgi:hypothetical protein